MKKKGRDRIEVWRAAIAASGLLLVMLTGCEEKKQAAAPPPPPEVTLAEVKQEKVPIVLQHSGTVKAVKNVKVIPRVSGYIFERNFTEGTFVEKDDSLYLIDPRPFEDHLAQLKAKLVGQQSTLKFWQSEEKRYTKLSKEGAASVERAEGARAKRDASQADIAETKVEIRNAELDLSYTKITAPFRGRIEQTLINVGNLVQKQTDVLTSLVQMDPIYVVFNISRRDAFNVQELRRAGNGLATKDMTVEAILPDGSAYEKQGKINFISFEIDPTTDSITVRGIFDNPMDPKIGDFRLIPGAYAPVRVTVGAIPKALVIPQTAVVETQAGAHVYVVGQDNKAERRVVELGTSHGEEWIVTKGLKQGEKVVVEGVQKVKSGIEVKPTKPKAKPATEKSNPEPSQAAEPETKQ